MKRLIGRGTSPTDPVPVSDGGRLVWGQVIGVDGNVEYLR